MHDSFWTHPGDVPRMGQLLREQFVALHSQPLLEQLLESFQVGRQMQPAARLAVAFSVPDCKCNPSVGDPWL